MSEYTILLVEDEAAQREALQAHLTDEDYNVLTAESAKIAINTATSKTIDVVITDFNLPDNDGQYVLEQIKAINPTIPVIFITAYGNVDRAVNAMKGGAFDYLTKPIDIDKLILIIKRALQHKTLVSENKRLRKILEDQFSFKGIIAKSSKMQEVLNLAGRVAETKASILLRGESGTGKEVVARAIHYASLRKDEPFVAFNVAALPSTLIESELFGHEKGAFTGADQVRIGRFEQAKKGTLFIDEIGDVPLEVQTKFLRVLQENTFERLGGNVPIKTDIRVIAATHKDIESMISEGTFREDLYYRLNVVTITIPPLRERKDDIPPLCRHFLRKSAEENGKDVDDFSRETFDALMKYHFPGNVRELENVVARAVILARGKQITLDDLPDSIFTDEVSSVSAVAGSLEEQVEVLEKNSIRAELRKCGGNQSKTARNLKLTERKLRYKIQKYDIE
ncbi:sigma-54-dependent transcriptional regulator [Candidatus Latescibacterota bacterium]